MSEPDWLEHATEFSFTHSDEQFTISLRQRAGEDSIHPSETDRWAVCLHGLVLDKRKNKFVYEPFPSNRTPAFIRNCRFDSLAAAYKALTQWWNTWERCGPGWTKKPQKGKRKEAR